MKKRKIILCVGIILIGLLLIACQLTDAITGLFSRQSSPSMLKTPLGQPVAGGPALIVGSFTYTNDFVVETYYSENAVAINDLTGFIKRDKEWELPIEGQVLGYMQVDKENNNGTYRIALPAVPEGVLNDVNHDNKQDKGVQIFAVTYSPNLTGGPFSEGDDPSFGWPAYLASVKTDTENKDEITGGKLLIWAQDDAQEFSSDFGQDNLLLTADDPMMKVPAGYSVIDLDQKPFAIIRDISPDLALYEPADIAVKDYSDLSYQEAFDKMFEKVRHEYAFNGYADKEPEWDALYAQIAPRIQKAQSEKDSYAFYLALRDFSMTFKDGHVGLDGGDNQITYNQQNILGGYGFAIRELSDGTSVVVYLRPGGPADKAGMRVGAQITAFNGLPIQQAIGRVAPFQPQSTDFGLRYEQTVFLTRAPVGAGAQVTFRNPGSASQTVTLTTIAEMDSLLATFQGGRRDENVLPADYRVLPERVGYIKVNSNYDDLNLIVRIFQRALETFKQNELPGIIIDMRHNYGGSPLGLAGFLHDKEIPLGQLEYYSEKTGKFEAEGPRDKVWPNVEQYRFDKMVLLVDQFCFSACEIESYGFSQVPGMLVMGQFPTAGVEAETARGDFKLPDGMSITIPTGRFTFPDGSLFLEGKGVQPTIRIPVDRDSVLSGQDAVLQQVIDKILSK